MKKDNEKNAVQDTPDTLGEVSEKMLQRVGIDLIRRKLLERHGVSLRCADSVKEDVILQQIERQLPAKD